MSSNSTKQFFGVLVHVNKDGLICLNDIHHAASGKPTKSPRHWLANKKTKELLALLEDGRVEQSHGGNDKGTYASMEVAIFYSTWVSANFNLKVIRTYCAIADAGLAGGDVDGLADIQRQSEDHSANWFA